MTKVMVTANKGILYPYDDQAADLLMKKSGTFSLDIKIARNPHFHRYVFKMLQIMYDMVDESLGFDPWRRALTVKAGYYTPIGHADGSVMVVPDSLSFENMDQEEFRECWNNIHAAFVEKYGKRLTDQQLNEWAYM